MEKKLSLENKSGKKIWEIEYKESRERERERVTEGRKEKKNMIIFPWN